jgi:hypothetical protein
VAYLAGLLFGIAFVWVFGAFFFRWVQDLPLGPIGLRGTNEQIRRNEQGAIESQRRLATFWRRGLWPVALACLIAAIILLIVAP